MPRPPHGPLGLSFLLTRLLLLLLLLPTIALTSTFISTLIASSTSPPTPLIVLLILLCLSTLYLIITIILYWDLQLPLLFTSILDLLFALALIIAIIIIGRPVTSLSCSVNKPAGGGVDGTRMLVESLATAVVPAPTFQALERTANNAYIVATSTAIPTSSSSSSSPAASTTQSAIIPTRTTISYITQTISNGNIAAASATAKSQIFGADGKPYDVQTVSSRFKKREVLQLERRHSEEDTFSKIGYSEWAKGLPGNGTDTCVRLKSVWGMGIALVVLFVVGAGVLVLMWKRERDGRRRVERKNLEVEK